MVPLLTTDHVSAFADIAVALAAGFAAWQGVKGLNAWKSERIGSRRIELAEEALIQFYEVENAFSVIRSPMSSSAETEGREPTQGESDNQRFARELAFTVFNRIQDQQELFSKFYATSLRIKAVFGTKMFEPFSEVRKCFGDVRVAAMMLQRTPYEGYKDLKFVEKLEQAVWNMERDEKDSIEVRIKASVERAELEFSKILDHY